MTIERRWMWGLGLSALASLSWGDSDEGLYLGLGLYDSRVDADQIDESEVAVQAAMGFRFNRYIGTEFDVYYLGDFSERAAVGTTLVEAEYSGWATGIAAVPRLPLSIFDLYARLGVIYYDVSYTTVTELGAERDDQSGFNGYGGVGASVNIGRHWSVFLDYTLVYAQERVDLAGLGARYLFDAKAGR